MRDTQSVTAELVLELLSPGETPVPVSTRFCYRADDPFAVMVDFLVEDDDWVTWTFARGLLDAGLLVGVGEGDVRVWPCDEPGGRGAYLRTSSPHGCATFSLPLDDVADFLQATYRAVPRGAESERLDIDHEIAALLAHRAD